MQPLSPVARRLYLVLFIGLFFAILPVVIFYADGWRFKPGYGFVRTGGIYISVPYQDATVSINGERVGKSGFLEHSFYINDLAPSAYIIHVERAGFRPWDRLLVVEEQLVTDTRALLLPQKITVMPIQGVTTTTFTVVQPTTTREVSNATIALYLAAFTATTTASTTIPFVENDGVGLFLVGSALSAKWLQKNAFPPSHFCERPSACVTSITLAENVVGARFHRGGVVYVKKDGSIYFTEVDIRETPINMLLHTVKGADIRVINDSLIVKSGKNLSEIDL